MGEIATKIIEEENDNASRTILDNVKSVKTDMGVTVSAAKIRTDMLDGITIGRCVHEYLVRACNEAKDNPTNANEWKEVDGVNVLLTKELSELVLTNNSISTDDAKILALFNVKDNDK